MATILLVDDDTTARQSLASLLPGQGHRLQQAASAAEALALALKEAPDLVIARAGLVESERYGLVRRLRSHPATAAVPLILTCASDSSPTACELALACGIVHLPASSSGPHEMLVAIAAALDREQRPQPLQTAGCPRQEPLLRLQAVFDQAADALLLADGEGRLVDLNAAACVTLGARRQELLQRPLWELAAPPTREALRQAWGDCLRTGRWHGECELAAKGQILELSVSFLRPDLYLFIGRDVTERRKAEQALRESEERWRSLVENAPDHILIANRDGTPRFINRVAAGFQLDEFLSSNLLDYLTPETRLVARSAWERTWETGQPTDYECQTTVPTSTWYYSRVGAIRREDQTVGLMIVARDISERKYAEATLAETNRALQTLIQASPLAVVVLDLRGLVKTWNPAARRLFGWSALEVVGKEMPGVPREQRASFAAWIEQHLQGNGRTPLELRHLRKGGSLIDVNLWPAHLHDAAGTVSGTLVLYADVTERKKAERERERLLRQVRRGRRRLRALSRQLLAGQEEERRHIARELHDEIGQILTAVRINLEAVKRLGAAEAQARLDESLNVVDQAIGQARDLSLDLRPPLLDDLGLTAALRWYVDRQAQRAGLEAHLSTPPAEVRWSAALETGCFRVAQEALTNVVRHARARHVWVELEQQEGALHLMVRDDGIGFDPRAVRQRTGPERTFGLLGMQERVELLGGQITIDSRPGQGTYVYVRFPLPSAE